jgi:hypothetical protein
MVRAADGTKITLPNSKEILKEFPQRKAVRSPEGTFSHYPFVQLVTACNVLTGQPTAARLYNMYGSEREGVTSMVQNDFAPEDICLLDRGLDGVRVWSSFDRHHQFHITRLREVGKTGPTGLQYVHQFLRSRKSEMTLERQMKNSQTGEVLTTQLRLIRGRKLKDGSFLVVGTNLLDQKKYPADEILELYSRRWSIETMYHRVKTLFNIQAFHARQHNGLLQEIFSNLLILSMTSALAMHAAQTAGLDPKEGCPNLKNAAEVMKVLCKKQPGRSYPRYSRQPVNRWPYAKASKIELFKQGRRCNENQESKEQYKRRT